MELFQRIYDTCGKRPDCVLSNGNSAFVCGRILSGLAVCACLIRSNGICVVCRFYGKRLCGYGKSGRSLLTATVGGVVNLLLNFVLIPVLGVQGAAVATLASYFVSFLLRTVGVKRLIPFRLHIGRLSVGFIVLSVQTVFSVCELPMRSAVQAICIFILILLNIQPIATALRKIIQIKMKKEKNNDTYNDTRLFDGSCRFRYAVAGCVGFYNAVDFRRIRTDNRCCPRTSSFANAVSFGCCGTRCRNTCGNCFAAKLIRAGLERFRPQMIYFILGLLIGSLYAIVMGPTTLDTPKVPINADNFGIFAFVICIVILGGLEFLKQYFKNREKSGK